MSSYTLKYNGHELINSFNVSTRYANMPDIPVDATEFDCQHNSLNVLPNLPPELNILHCGHNLLVTLPNLPPELNELHCNHNLLNVLPALPNTMFLHSYLYCNHNLLVNLPPLPANLLELNCEHNQLRALPNLPDRLSILYCGNNQLVHLPINDQLTVLHCQNNRLIHFPNLPTFMTDLRFEGNPLSDNSIKQYGQYIQNNPGVRHDLHTFVTPEYGRFQSVYRSRNGVTRGTMSRLPVNIMNQISRRFHIGGKTKRKKKLN